MVAEFSHLPQSHKLGVVINLTPQEDYLCLELLQVCKRWVLFIVLSLIDEGFNVPVVTAPFQVEVGDGTFTR